MPPPLIEIDGSKLRLNFHEGQLRAWDSDRRFVAVVAGTQSGKTSFFPIWLWREIQRCGPGDYAVVCPTFTLMELKALPDFRHFFETTLHLGSYTGSPVRRFVVSKLGERLLFGGVQTTPTNVYFGYAENSDSLESSTYKAVVCDEAGQKGFKRSSYEALLRRLSIHRGRMLITTTPYGSTGWLKTEIYDRWKAGDATVDCIQFASTMNPAFPRAEFDRAVQTMPGWKVALFYMGRFERPAGAVYDCFDDQRNKCPRFSIPSHWPRTIGIDFGGANTAAVFFAEKMVPDREIAGRMTYKGAGQFFAYREYKSGSRTAKEHVEALLEGEPRQPNAVGGSGSEGQWRAEFRAAGLGVRQPGIDSVEAGIERVYAAFKTGNLVVFDDLTGLLDEIGSYAYKLDDNDEATDVLEDKSSYHRCFVAGTLVETATGPRPIEDVRPGDWVLTRQGFRRVRVAGLASEADVATVRFDDGRELTGTLDHPIWVDGSGWISIDGLRYNDTVVSLSGVPSCRAKASSFRASPTIATRSRREFRIGDTSNAFADIFTATFGLRVSGRFPRADSSTTRTGTPSTTTSATLNSSRRSSTPIATLPQSERSEAGNEWPTFALWLRRGMRRLRGGRGIVNTLARWLAVCCSSIRNAQSAMLHTRSNLWRQNDQSIAQTHVNRRHADFAATMTNSEFVRSAANASAATVTQKPSDAHLRVRTVRDSGRAMVYNLSVDDVHEYFANGVLVSNCDALRYACVQLFRPQSAPLPPQPQRPERMPGGDSNAGRRGILGRGEQRR